MLKHFLALVVMYTMTMVGLELLAGSTVLSDLLVGRMYWLPVMPLHGLPDIISPISHVLPVMPLLSLIYLVAAGLISLTELD